MIVDETASGFKPRVWMYRLLLVLLTEVRVSEPVSGDKEGTGIASGKMNKVFVTDFLKVKKERTDLEVCKDEVIWESYNIRRFCW